MNSTSSKPIAAIAGAILFAGMILAAHAGPASTNSAGASNSIPGSVFANLPGQGKDPFFPRSMRRSAEAPSADAGATTSDVTSLFLQGLSHAANRPLATINNQTFRPGEEGEVITSAGRMRIRCDEIREESVVISVGAGQQLELRLPNH